MNELYGSYRTLSFNDIYPDANSFLSDYKNQSDDFTNGIPTTINDTNATTLYYLLYSNYGNSHISNSDITQFKYRLFAIIFNFGSAWEANLTAQSTLKSLTEDEILQIQKAIVNHAYNPGDGATGTNDGNQILAMINEQNINKITKGKVEGYSLWASLFKDVTSEFIKKFKQLFITIVNPEMPLWYVTEGV